MKKSPVSRNERNRSWLRRAWRGMRRLARCEDGIAAVEFALIGPVLLVMISGVVEGGRLYYFQASLQNRVEDVGR